MTAEAIHEARRRIVAIAEAELDLSSLRLTAQDLQILQSAIGDITKLTNLAGNGLGALPDWLGNLTALTELNLASNQLSALPDWLRNLTALTELNLANNQLSGLCCVDGARQVSARL